MKKKQYNSVTLTVNKDGLTVVSALSNTANNPINYLKNKKAGK